MRVDVVRTGREVKASKGVKDIGALGGQVVVFFFSSRRRHTRFDCDWSSDVCSSDLSRFVQRYRQSVASAIVRSGATNRSGLSALMKLNHHRAGSGEPLVLIHGIGSRWQMWEPVLGAVEAEREVIALDLPGFAGSPPPPPGTPPGVDSLTRLVSEFLDELGLDRPHVAGNSLGGWLSPERPKRARVRPGTVLSPPGAHHAPGR